jgi:hypothetical protein
VQSKSKAAPTVAEAEYIRLVKLCPCSVCDEGGGYGAPSEAHEIEQGAWWLSVALCASCHRGPLMGLHGQRRMWAIKKMSELDALAVTIRRVLRAIALEGRAPAALAKAPA